MYAIRAEKLTKKFGDFTAVDSINLSIKKGEIFGFLGPNGAGKTTTIKMLSTLLHPSSGSASVWNYNTTTRQNDVRKSIGIVFQDTAVDGQLTGEENLDFHARMYGMSAHKRKKRISYVLKLVDLTDKSKMMVQTYSGGMRRRLEIARGLMHFPKVLFLDEPTLGLDPQTRRHIWEYIKQLNKKENVTILLTTHYMEEADSLCNRIGIIDRGKMIVINTPAKLKNGVGEDVITIGTEKPNELLNLIKKMKMGKPIIHNSNLDISVKSGEKHIPSILRLADKNKIKINSINLRKPTLEDVFLYYTGKTIREEEGSAKDNFRLQAKMWGRK